MSKLFTQKELDEISSQCPLVKAVVEIRKAKAKKEARLSRAMIVDKLEKRERMSTVDKIAKEQAEINGEENDKMGKGKQ